MLFGNQFKSDQRALKNTCCEVLGQKSLSETDFKKNKLGTTARNKDWQSSDLQEKKENISPHTTVHSNFSRVVSLQPLIPDGSKKDTGTG